MRHALAILAAALGLSFPVLALAPQGAVAASSATQVTYPLPAVTAAPNAPCDVPPCQLLGYTFQGAGTASLAPLGAPGSGEFSWSFAPTKLYVQVARLALGAETASVSLSGLPATTPLAFDFGGASVAPGSTVTFTQTATGPGTVAYNTGTGTLGVHDMTCPGVTETVGTTPPLDTFRRDSVGLAITQLPTPGITSITPSSGSIKGGTKVTIIGHDFSGTSVNFGSKLAASFTVNSPTQITAVSPPGSALGAVHVSVTTGGGTSATVAADEFSYTACVVPKLKGKTLTKARKALQKADCKLGKVTPKGQTTGHVIKQKPKTGTVLAPGSKVQVKLG